MTRFYPSTRMSRTTIPTDCPDTDPSNMNGASTSFFSNIKSTIGTVAAYIGRSTLFPLVVANQFAGATTYGTAYGLKGAWDGWTGNIPTDDPDTTTRTKGSEHTQTTCGSALEALKEGVYWAIPGACFGACTGLVSMKGVERYCYGSEVYAELETLRDQVTNMTSNFSEMLYRA